MKYKVGDKVKIKTWEELEKEFGPAIEGYINTRLRFHRVMDADLNYLDVDRIVTIKSITSEKNYDIKELYWKWSEDIIEYVPEIFESIKSRWEILDL